jgi:hypothetical protein
MTPTGARHYTTTVTVPPGGLDYYIAAKTMRHPAGAPQFVHYIGALGPRPA